MITVELVTGTARIDSYKQDFAVTRKILWFLGTGDDVLVENMGNPFDVAVSRQRRSKCLEWLRYVSAYLILTYGTRKLVGGGQFALGRTLGSRPIGSLSGFELTWFYYAVLARIRDHSWTHAGSWWSVATVPEKRLAGSRSAGAGDGQHPNDQHLFFI